MKETTGRFEGFADSQAKFFRALAKNQNREWFQAHKPEFEEGWQKPMDALLTELSLKLGGSFGGRELGPPKVFRIFRDVRFAKDKSPYKTHIGGYIPVQKAAAIYLQLGTESFAGGGCWMMSPEQLDRYRAAVIDEKKGTALTKIISKLEKAGFKIESHDTLKKVPRGMDPEHPRAALLKNKGLTVTFPALPMELIVSRELVSWLTRETKKTVSFTQWLEDV